MKIKKRAVVVPDQHFPIHDQKAVDCAIAIMKFLKPDVFINLGDVGEWESVSAWKYKVNKGIDQFDKVLDKIGCKERYILAGNHDEWLDRFAENKVGGHSLLNGYTFEKACKWKERGYKYYRYNQPLKLGKVNFIHGAYVTTYHAKKHLEAYGANIVYGHTHDIQRHTLTKLDSGTIGAWSMGCLKDMRHEKNCWLRGRLHNWNHAVGVVDWFANGNFKIEVIEIIKGVTSVWGKVISA